MTEDKPTQSVSSSSQASKFSLLRHEKNPYGGVHISCLALADVDERFFADLEYSLTHWSAEGIKVVWMQIPRDRIDLLSHVYLAGFDNHHCRREFIMVTKRLVDGALIPDFANHTIGVGGIVVNEADEVLSIRELGHIEKYPHNWKFPGGMLDLYEHIEDGVKREVFEETGINTEFEGFLGFRHGHVGQFQTSNIYALCLLKPLNHEIVIQATEIADARWFPIDDYLADEKIGQYNKLLLKSALANKGFSSVKLPGYARRDDEYEVFVPSSG